MKNNYVQRVLIFVLVVSFSIPVCADQDAELIAQRNTLRQEVKKGMTEAEVRKIMGPPDEVRAVKYTSWDSREYRYAYGVKQPGTLPFIGSVFFGPQAKVVGTVVRDVMDYSRKSTAEKYTEWEMKSYLGFKIILLNAKLPGKKSENKLSEFDVEIENLTNQIRRLRYSDRHIRHNFYVTVYSSSRQVLFSEITGLECNFSPPPDGKEFITRIPPNSKISLSFSLYPMRFMDPLPSGKYFVRVWFPLDGSDTGLPLYPSNLVEVEVPGN